MSLININKKDLQKLMEERFEARVIQRGKDYANKGHVLKKEYLNPNYLYGVVEGTELYTTEVVLYEGKLYAKCTCPYEEFCKHAVALLLGEPKKKKPASLKEFRRRLIRELKNTGFIEFDPEEWKELISSNSKEEISSFILEVAEYIVRGDHPYNEGYEPSVDELAVPFIQTLHEVERAEFFWKLYNTYDLRRCISSYVPYFSLFSEKDRQVLRSFYSELKKKDEEYEDPFMGVFLEEGT